MLQYIIAFSLYTLAMIGIMTIAFAVYKKTTSFNGIKPEVGMKIEDMLRLSQRKSLYIINVQGERFLIAADVENTTFLAKLNSEKNEEKKPLKEEKKELSPDEEEKRIMNTLFSNSNKSQKTDKNNLTKNKIEKYIKELEGLELSDRLLRQEEENDHSNAIDIKSRKTLMKNILKELDSNSKRNSI